jgi:hypothetical protein
LARALISTNSAKKAQNGPGARLKSRYWRYSQPSRRSSGVRRHVRDDSYSLIKAAWRRWQRFAHRAAEIQSRVLLVLVYFALVTPVTVVIAFVKRRGASRTPMWHLVASPPESVESAKTQF